ncbi:flagellar export chaperone FlgN [Simkania negevensis]|uniref:Flagellar export chaperone FlgN n=1 Tax=Simkania negevensis TaxID=83561 RepID=A0ABS3APR4_9BACT|nr:flagellar export chaperone FlgN [Simkania negevensis]
MEKAEKELLNLFNCEEMLLRKFFDNVCEEQQAIMHSDIEAVRKTVKEREPLMYKVTVVKERRVELVHRLLKQLGIDTDKEELFKNNALTNALIEKGEGGENEILSCRDKVVFLLEKIQTQAERNQYLLKAKIGQTKELVAELCKGEQYPTYTGSGSVQTQKKKTITVINHEV